MKKLSELGISPAPWYTESYETTNTHYVINSIGQKVTVFCKWKYGEANARLIAAAPELYDMLQSLVEYIDRECIPCGETACELLFAAHNVLSKAAGEEVGDGK